MRETTMPAASSVADDTSGAAHINESRAVLASIVFGRLLNHCRFQTELDFLIGVQREETASLWTQLSIQVRSLSLAVHVQEFLFSTVNAAHADLQQYVSSVSYPTERRELSDTLIRTNHRYDSFEGCCDEHFSFFLTPIDTQWSRILSAVGSCVSERIMRGVWLGIALDQALHSRQVWAAMYEAEDDTAVTSDVLGPCHTDGDCSEPLSPTASPARLRQLVRSQVGIYPSDPLYDLLWQTDFLPTMIVREIVRPTSDAWLTEIKTRIREIDCDPGIVDAALRPGSATSLTTEQIDKLFGLIEAHLFPPAPVPPSSNHLGIAIERTVVRFRGRSFKFDRKGRQLDLFAAVFDAGSEGITRKDLFAAVYLQPGLPPCEENSVDKLLIATNKTINEHLGLDIRMDGGCYRLVPLP